MEYYLDALKKYATFDGRATRKQYWMFVLCNIVISALLSAVDSLMGTDSVATGFYSIAILLPNIALLVRRIHDIGKSGLWAFIGLVPIIGVIILFIFCVKDSEQRDNAYGPNLNSFTG